MDEKSNRGGKTAGIIITIVVVLAGLIGAWYWFMLKPEQEAKEKARLEQIAIEEAKKKREEQAAMQKAQYDKLIEKGDNAFEEENWDEAQSAYAEASSLFPKSQYAQDRLALANEKLDEIANRSKVGTVETVSTATGRFYIIVSSSVDGDLAMDFANKLTKEGNNVKIIKPPANNRVFHRVSLGDYNSRDEAATASTSISTTYENGTWILKY